MVDLLTFVALPIAIVSALALGLIYLFMLKPRIEEPLPNEHDEGLWRIPLLQYGMKEGKVCTARRYIQRNYADLIEASPPNDKPSLMALRDKTLNKHIFAQRVGRDKNIYAFNLNPNDEQFHIRDDATSRFGTSVAIKHIIHIQDAKSAGKGSDGFNYFGVTLRPEGLVLTEEEREIIEKENTNTDIFLEGMKNVSLAATGKEEKKHLETRIGILETHLSKAYDKLNEGTSNQAESDLIASTTSLTHPEVQKPSGFHWPKATEFFTGWQVAIAIIAYLVTPNAMAAAGIVYPDPQTVAVGVAFFLFLAFPFVRKLIHR